MIRRRDEQDEHDSRGGDGARRHPRSAIAGNAYRADLRNHPSAPIDGSIRVTFGVMIIEILTSAPTTGNTS